MKYSVYALYTVSKYVGEVEAGSKEEAEEKAYEHLSEEMYASICHQCAQEITLGDIDSLDIEETA